MLENDADILNPAYSWRLVDCFSNRGKQLSVDRHAHLSTLFLVLVKCGQHFWLFLSLKWHLWKSSVCYMCLHFFGRTRTNKQKNCGNSACVVAICLRTFSHLSHLKGDNVNSVMGDHLQNCCRFGQWINSLQWTHWTFMNVSTKYIQVILQNIKWEILVWH